MSLKDAVNKAGSKWMAGTGPDNDIVISSRVRLARNICGYPFPHFIKEKEAEQVFQAVQLAVSDQELKSVAGELEFTNLAELTDNERMILVEKHLVSPQHIDNPQNRAVVISEDESVSIMVNEEDHLRIQCLQPGLQLEETWALADKIDDLLEKSLDYSFCEKRGYLTSCPTNVGTGLRASVMLHLPCLVVGKQVGKIVHAIAQLGLAVRGYYGEGTEAHGNLFQVSNQVTMGQTEEDIVKNLLTVTQKVVAQERAIRETVIKDNLKFFEDKIYRAFGIMSNARLMTSKEALKNISDLRLGVQLGMLQGLTYGLINELMMLSTPAFLSKAAGRTLNTEERDWFRAETIRKQLTNIQI